MPKLKLTSNLNLSQYQNPKPVYLWDTITKGFGIKVNPSGKHRYITMFRSIETKRQKFVTLGLVSQTNIKDAKKEAKRFIAERFVPEKPKVISLSKLLTEYVERRRLKPSTVYDMKIITNRFFDTDTDISKFTNESVEKWYLSNSHRKTSTDRAKRYAHTLFQYAIGKSWVKENPFSVIKNPKITYKKKAKDVYLDENEILVFLREMEGCKSSKTTLDMIRFYLITGIRRNEIYKAEVQVDCIFIPDTKNGKDLRIPRNQYVDKYLHLFETELPWSIRKTLINLSKPIKKNITIHTLRHSFISLCAFLNIPPSVIQRCVNHSSRSITENVYTHRKVDAEVNNAFRVVGQYLEAEL